jgi:capsular exopolysaccharide synthesis family protein
MLENKQRVLLITSSAPREGKTTVSANLALSFAKANIKTIVIDCDFRKPRIHQLFKDPSKIGLVNYLQGQASFEEIIKKSNSKNLDYIIAGTIPSNPNELLSSAYMELFLQKLQQYYEIIIIDSPPVMAVSDAEVLEKLVDLSVLVVSADKTEIEWMEESSDILKKYPGKFFGILLNNFNNKSSYHSYYKYYNDYAYSHKA